MKGRVLGDQRLRHLHLRRRRGDREAGGDGQIGAAATVPGGEHRVGVVVGGLGGVADAVGAVAVHHHLAADHPHARGPGGREEGVHRGGARAVGDAVVVPWREELVEEGPGDAGGVLRVGEARLRGEGVGVQPVEKLRPPGGDHLRLGHVDVGVDEARHQQVRPVVDGPWRPAPPPGSPRPPRRSPRPARRGSGWRRPRRRRRRRCRRGRQVR